MTVIKITQEPKLTRWYSGKVGECCEHVPRYDDEEYYGCRDHEGYINFVVKTDGVLVKLT